MSTWSNIGSLHLPISPYFIFDPFILHSFISIFLSFCLFFFLFCFHIFLSQSGLHTVNLCILFLYVNLYFCVSSSLISIFVPHSLSLFTSRSHFILLFTIPLSRLIGLFIYLFFPLKYLLKFSLILCLHFIQSLSLFFFHFSHFYLWPTLSLLSSLPQSLS